MSAAHPHVHVVLTETGVLQTGRDAAMLDALRPGDLGASLFPSAGPEARSTLTLLCTAWAFYDDAIEKTGLPDPAVSRALRTGSAAQHAAPIVHVFAEVGSRLRVRSRSWRRRFVAAFDETVATVRQERLLRAELAAGILPGTARYLAWRRVNIGLHAMLPLVEHALDQETCIHHEAWTTRWVAACTDVFLAVNDRVGHASDGPRRLDLAACLARDGADIDTFLHQARVRADQLHAELRARHAENDALLAWLQGVHDLLDGWAAWHDRAPRYRPAT